MNATFPLRKSFILQGAILAAAFLMLLAGSIVLPLLFRMELILRLFMGVAGTVLWGGMLLMSIYILFAGLRVKVIVQENRVSDIGIFSRKEFELTEVTLARWELRGHLGRPRLVVIAPAGLVAFDFRVHRTSDARQLIGFFRSGLPPHVQQGWTPEWDELAVSLDCERRGCDALPWWKLTRACWLAGAGSGLIGGVLAYFLLSGLPMESFTLTGFVLVDWTVYGLVLGLAFSIPITALALLADCGRWLDA